jgi:hypothetical protein
MSAIIGLLPEQRAGVFILANLDHAELRHALMYRTFDLYIGGPSRDWSGELRALLAAGRSSGRAAARDTSAVERPALPLDRYAGTYVDSVYGTIQVTLTDGALRAQIVSEPARQLEPWRHDSFRTRGSGAEHQPTLLSFVPDGLGNITAVRFSGITFARVGASNR